MKHIVILHLINCLHFMDFSWRKGVLTELFHTSKTKKRQIIITNTLVSIINDLEVFNRKRPELNFLPENCVCSLKSKSNGNHYSMD